MGAHSTQSMSREMCSCKAPADNLVAVAAAVTHLVAMVVTVRSLCRCSVAVKKHGSREVRYVELQSRSLQQVEVEVVSGNIASRGASEILRQLRITQGRSGLWNT
jgi:hypothetical protein